MGYGRGGEIVGEELRAPHATQPTHADQSARLPWPPPARSLTK